MEDETDNSAKKLVEQDDQLLNNWVEGPDDWKLNLQKTKNDSIEYLFTPEEIDKITDHIIENGLQPSLDENWKALFSVILEEMRLAKYIPGQQIEFGFSRERT